MSALPAISSKDNRAIRQQSQPKQENNSTERMRQEYDESCRVLAEQSKKSIAVIKDALDDVHKALKANGKALKECSVQVKKNGEIFEGQEERLNKLENRIANFKLENVS